MTFERRGISQRIENSIRHQAVREEAFRKRIEPSVWSRQPTGFSWQARPAFFSGFWKSEWR